MPVTTTTDLTYCCRVATALWRAALGLLLCLAAYSPLLAAEDFLPPEQAFKVSARLVSASHVEVLVRIAPGYYAYREPFQFSARGASLGLAAIPAGQQKFDENFQKTVETYRGEVRIGLPVEHAGAPFTLTVVSQGCADAGLCYPPMTTETRLDPGSLLTLGGGAAAQSVAPQGRAEPERWWDGAMMDRVLRGGHVWQVIGFFFGMGVLLSLTPCVLPMLPILSSLIVGVDQRPSRRRGLALAAAYSLGMAMVYTALGLAAGLAGEGLAAALQTPWAIGGFALLLAVFALSMFDVYELRLPSRLTGHLTNHCNRLPPGRVAAVFLMGGVSALIVSPCVTAPLAGALLFISQSGDVWQGGSALFAMAVGMSVPLLLLGASAGRWVPKAGAWMYGVKRLFGLLMLGVALWVAQPVLPIVAVLGLWGLLLLLTGFLLEPFSAQIHHRHALRTGLQRALGVVALTLGIAQLVGAASGGRDPLRPLAHFGASQAVIGRAPAFQLVRSEAELDLALKLAGGRPVMLDFYADWCVSCKEMERFTFSDVTVSARLGKALLLKADVTANSEDERALLRRFKLFGPPGTLFFDSQRQEIASARVVGFQGVRQFGEALSRAGL
jgi:thiol:disulfide interchange protein DsbD